MKIDTYATISDAYLGVLADVIDNPDYKSSPRGLAIREKLDYAFRVTNPTQEPIQTKSESRNVIIADYTKKEAELYNSDSDLAKDYAKISTFWQKLANPNGTINSAYGKLIFSQWDQGDPSFDHGNVIRSPWEWARFCLVNDHDTRQAILRFNRSKHLWDGNKDVVCTMYGIFHIRDGNLHLTMHMRSNDVFYGLVYDMPWFCSLMYKMRDELSNVGSKSINVGIGNYTHIVDSLHAYERNMKDILAMLGR